MKRQDKIIKNIEANKDLLKAINGQSYSDIEDFVNNAKRYINAIREGRMCCVIDTVSKSGMSRTIKFMECSGTKANYHYYNFYLLFTILGYSKVRDRDTFRIHGCGMDMIFHTNYTIIHRLHRLGFINKVQCEELAQCTPAVL